MGRGRSIGRYIRSRDGTRKLTIFWEEVDTTFIHSNAH